MRSQICPRLPINMAQPTKVYGEIDPQYSAQSSGN